MRRQLFTIATIGAAAALQGGCTQTVRHSNTMLFGTNTTFGIKAGTSAANTPDIVIGYDRQEAVIMPLVANVRSKQGSTLLEPCDMTKDLKVVGDSDGYLVHPCSLVAYKAGSMDSYSVLASFGAEFSADTAGAPKASGGLAQYFATGMAAQILAAKGGAALVSTSEAAKASAEEPAQLASLFPEGTSFAHARAVAFDNSIGTLRAHIKGTTDPATLDRKIKAFLGALKSAYSLDMTTGCTSSDACLAALREDIGPISESPNLGAAVSGWDTY